MGKKLPRLVILSGPSGSGKSSTARELAQELGLAILAKDDMKEALFDSLGRPADEDESSRLDTACYLLIERLGQRILEAGVGVVVEGNFGRGLCETSLGPLVARSHAAIVHLDVEPAAMVKRIKKRVEGKKKRHPGHMDHDPDPVFVELLEDPQKFVEHRPDVEPPNLNVPIYRLDTTEKHSPRVDKIARWVEKATAE